MAKSDNILGGKAGKLGRNMSHVKLFERVSGGKNYLAKYLITATLLCLLNTDMESGLTLQSKWRIHV